MLLILQKIGFYNFLNGYYNLSYSKAKKLEDFIINLL